jgi:hypothetical protein
MSVNRDYDDTVEKFENATWRGLLDLCEKYIRYSYEQNLQKAGSLDYNMVPWTPDLIPNCKTKDDVDELLSLQKENLLVIADESTCLHGGIRSTKDSEHRDIPMITFVVKGNSNKPSLENLLNDSKLAVHVWDGRTTKAYWLEKHAPLQLEWYRRKGDSEGWQADAPMPPWDYYMSLAHVLGVRKTKVLEGEEDFYVCEVAMRITDDIMAAEGAEGFESKIREFNLVKQILSNFKSAKRSRSRLIYKLSGVDREVLL